MVAGGGRKRQRRRPVPPGASLFLRDRSRPGCWTRHAVVYACGGRRQSAGDRFSRSRRRVRGTRQRRHGRMDRLRPRWRPGDLGVFVLQSPLPLVSETRARCAVARRRAARRLVSGAGAGWIARLDSARPRYAGGRWVSCGRRGRRGAPGPGKRPGHQGGRHVPRWRPGHPDRAKGRLASRTGAGIDHRLGGGHRRHRSRRCRGGTRQSVGSRRRSVDPGGHRDGRRPIDRRAAVHAGAIRRVGAGGCRKFDRCR